MSTKKGDTRKEVRIVTREETERLGKTETASVIGLGVAETIDIGGSGGEANVKLQLRTRFPGIGGVIKTSEGVAVALREQYNISKYSGDRMYLKHTLIKKLDDYFFRKGKYIYSHIPRPLGSISNFDYDPEGDKYEAHIYEWIFGSEGFPWKMPNKNRILQPIELRDWKSFKENFISAGIDLGYDTTAADDGRISQNMIHQFSKINKEVEMCCLWKRIDFGEGSIIMDYKKLSKFLHDNEEDLIHTLEGDRYKILVLIAKYLSRTLTEREIGSLETLIGAYRLSTLSHYLKGFGPASDRARMAVTIERLK